jgi:hypothetical protein
LRQDSICTSDIGDINHILRSNIDVRARTRLESTSFQVGLLGGFALEKTACCPVHPAGDVFRVPGTSCKSTGGVRLALRSRDRYVWGCGGRRDCDGYGYEQGNKHVLTDERLQLRAEAYNALNHPNYGNPDACVDCSLSSNPSKITDVARPAIWSICPAISTIASATMRRPSIGLPHPRLRGFLLDR